MKRILRCLCALLLPCLFSCSTVQPDGVLKPVLEGEVFTGDSTREPERHENEMLMKPQEVGGPVRWKLSF